MTFGDVLAVVAGLIGVCLSAWTTLVFFSLFFPGRADQAANSIQASASKTALRGFGIVLLLVVAALALFNIHQPLPTVLAWIVLLLMLSLAALGGSGLTLLAAARVHEQEPKISAYAALMRGAALVVVPGLLPVFGWFIVAPLMLFVGVGAGTRALRISPAPTLA